MASLERGAAIRERLDPLAVDLDDHLDHLGRLYPGRPRGDDDAGVLARAEARRQRRGQGLDLDASMNLVAKEFVAAKEDLDGVLILSELAGAARELSEALIIGPFDIEQFAEAIRAAVEMQMQMEMEKEERLRRMEQLRRGVEEQNIYWWAARFMTELAATRSARVGPQEDRAEEPVSGGGPAAISGARQPGEIP